MNFFSAGGMSVSTPVRTFRAGPSSSAEAERGRVVTAGPWAATHLPRAARFLSIPPDKVQKRAGALGSVSGLKNPCPPAPNHWSQDAARPG